MPASRDDESATVPPEAILVEYELAHLRVHRLNCGEPHPEVSAKPDQGFVR
jgi:hypothetical protein